MRAPEIRPTLIRDRSKYLPKRELFAFIPVRALPNDSIIGFTCKIFSSRFLFWVCRENMLCGFTILCFCFEFLIANIVQYLRLFH